MLPITLPQADVDTLVKLASKREVFTVDLQSQTVRAGDLSISFEINAFRKECLLGGFDDIALTLKNEYLIRQFETKRSAITPWLDLENASAVGESGNNDW
jgi:3-isopropylmalate/(R)-2-methylmalate dehydratase small subunit